MKKELQRVDDLMKNVFGSTVKLLDYYGPVQMCCFGLTYSYLPTHEKIIFECERGIIIVNLVDVAGKIYNPSNYFEESNYYHYEDVESDLKDLITAIKRIVEMER